MARTEPGERWGVLEVQDGLEDVQLKASVLFCGAPLAFLQKLVQVAPLTVSKKQGCGVSRAEAIRNEKAKAAVSAEAGTKAT